MMRHHKTKLNKAKHISKSIWHINQLRTTRTHVIKTLIKEKHWRKTHLTYGTQHGWYLTGSSMPTTQRLSWENKRIKEYNSFW